MINVFVVDDHKILIDSFVNHFENIGDISIVGYALSGGEAIEMLHPSETKIVIDIILLDIGLNDMNGIECAKVLLKNDPLLKIIGLSSYMQVSIVKKMLKTGAKAYLSKATDIAQLAAAIRAVNEGNTFLGQHIQKALLDEVYTPSKANYDYVIPKLTGREKEVLSLIADEYNTKDIAKELFISTHTVETHRKNLISKFHVKNSVGLLRKAIELGIIEV